MDPKSRLLIQMKQKMLPVQPIKLNAWVKSYIDFTVLHKSGFNQTVNNELATRNNVDKDLTKPDFTTL